MRTIILFLLVFSGLCTNAQTSTKKFSRAIYIGSAKADIIEEVIEKVISYFNTNTDGILTLTQKKKKLKLKTFEDRMLFFDDMDGFLYKKLEASDQWGFDLKTEIEREYYIDIMTIIGSYFNFGMVGKPNNGTNGKLFITLGFKNSQLLNIYGTMTAVKENYIHNGFGYSDAMLTNLGEYVTKAFGSYNHTRFVSSSNMCDAYKTEPVYYERFNLNNGKTTGYVEAVFGPYVAQINKNSCRYKGNMITEVSLWMSALK